MEASGGFNDELAFYLVEAKHVVSVVNASSIKAFGESRLSRTKTGRSDAELIARFCKAMQPEAWTQYVAAGCEGAYLLAPDRTHALGATSPIVGLMDDDAAFGQRVVTLSAGSIVAAVTDGFTEARNESLEFLGRVASRSAQASRIRVHGRTSSRRRRGARRQGRLLSTR